MIPLHCSVLLWAQTLLIARAELSFLTSDLEALRDDISPQLSGIAEHQGVQIDALSMGLNYMSQVDRIAPIVTAPASQQEPDVEDVLTLPVYIDVVLIGFDAQSMDMINNNWLQRLNIKDRVEATLGNRSSPVDDGAPVVSYHYRLVHTSFHVQRTLSLFLQQHMRPRSEEERSAHYVNANDVEQVLEDLSSAIYGGEEPGKISATIFVLNHVGADSNGGSGAWHSNYGYMSGYSAADIEGLTEDTDVIDKALKVVHERKSLSKLDLAAVPIPPMAKVNKYMEGGDSEDKDRLAILDAVHSTRLWALQLRDRLNNEPVSNLRSRVRALLSAKHAEGTTARSRQLALARDVLSGENGLQTTGGCTSRSWFSRDRLVWIDLSAAGATPVMTALEAGTTRTVPHAPPAVLISDPGSTSEGVVMDVASANKKIQTGVRSLFSYFKQLKAVARQMECDLTVVDAESGHRDHSLANPFWKSGLSHVGSTVVRNIGTYSPMCSHLLVRLGLVKHMLAAQEELRDLLTNLEPQLSEAAMYSLNDIVVFEKRLQIEVLRAIRADLVHHDNGEHDSRAYSLGDETASTPLHVYMGELANIILKITEQAVTPSLSLSSFEKSGAANKAPLSERKEILFNAYHAAPQLLRESRGFISGHPSVLSLSFYELVESFTATTAKFTAKLKNGIITSNNKGNYNISEFEGHILPLYIPEKIEITVYLVILQSGYKAIGPESIDAAVMLSELQRFKLSSQRMAITVHTTDIAGEDRLMRALLACRRSVHRTGEQSHHVYLDPWCLWEHVKEGNLDSGMASTRRLQRLPVFVFSVDFPTPVYLGEGYDNSVSIGEAVIVIQNYQKKMPTGMYCGGEPFYINGRNPLAPLLMSVGASLAGLSHSHADSRYTSVSSAHLCGQSPVFSGAGVVTPTFSELDLDASYRNRLLRSISASTWLIKEKWEATLLSSHEWATAINHNVHLYNETTLLAQYRSMFEAFIPHHLLDMREKALTFVEELDWLRGSRACNDFLSAALELKSSEFSFWSNFEDDFTFGYETPGVEPDVLHVLIDDAWRNGSIWGQFVVAAVSACVCYAGAGWLWRVATQNRKI